ncbi:hypothetical protein KUTeg_020391 [Tegillarca granosa]|uniref:BTB domain-containing protein n=1 Tax=Tegillarca granosa TaxID=220873 RepID=A0ABQ9E7T4_TEGGR|nr:hypothetical protein KUTeg_020391 [Tegillarca granosa]
MASLERCDSLAVLTEHEQQVEYTSTDSEGDGSSSGYDSASDTDIIYQAADLLLGIPEISKSSKNQTREKMNFQNTTALCNHLKYIISMPDLCDVRFLVGEENIPIYGVKAIMATRSRTFYHLIIKHQKKQETNLDKKGKKKKSSPKHLTIDVKKYDSDVFRKIIQFVHCGSVDITMENVAGE